MNAQQFLAEFGHIANAPGGVGKLRELVLHLAVSGKLTIQVDGEDAADFFDEMKAIQSSLQSDGTIRVNRKIRFEKNQGRWQIPPNWLWCRFGELCSFSAGRTPSRKESKYWNTGDYPWFSIADMNHGQVVTSSSETVSEEARAEVFRSEPSPVGSLLMSFKLSIGKLSLLGVPAYHNEAIITIEPFAPELKEYFFKCLNGFDLSAGNKAAIKGNTLNQDSLSNILVALPPKNEISRIVTKVDELLALCDTLEAQQQARRKLENALRQSTLQAVASATSPHELQTTWARLADNFGRLFHAPEDVGQLRDLILDLAVHGILVDQSEADEPITDWLTDIAATKAALAKQKLIPKQTAMADLAHDEYPFPLPKGWAFVRLGQITNKIGSGSTPRGGREVYVKEGVPFLRSQNVWNDGLHLDDVACITPEEHERMSGTAVLGNDVLLNITGASLGRCALVPSEFGEANVSQHVTIIRLTDPQVREYLHLCILSPYTQSMIWGRQVGMAREGLSKKVLEQFEIPLPPVAEQHRIVARVAELMRFCDVMERQLKRSLQVAEKLAVASVASLTGIVIEQEEEPMKAPQTELIAPLRLGIAPDIKAQAPLATILARHHGEMSAKDLS